ncbi:hypothetical protein ACIRD8_34930 [Streptomyces sp. NPDC102451]|uniref:hypothetical protein n=1 Tax=Streptomyces sp. NPDC102451 TaxID=3366177 RepID=UPI003825C91B
MTTPPISPRLQATYRAYIVHTQKCQNCRSGTNCDDASKLRTAYRAAERKASR